MPAAEAASAYSREDIERLFEGFALAGPLALAVSGGSDSTALMRLAAEWGGSALHVLTVDHGLRAGSAHEAEQVAAWARAIGLPHDTLVWPGEKPTAGIQAAARKARYGLLTAAAKERGCGALLTAHTIEDQAETVVMRLQRTASPDAISGIAPRLEVGGIPVIRPLLRESRGRLRAHLRAVAQEWIEDPSNSDERFERVRIRRALAASELPPQAFARLADEQRAVAMSLWDAARLWVDQYTEHHGEGYAVAGAAAFAGLDRHIAARVLGLLIARYGGGSMPEPRERENLTQWLMNAGGSRRTLGGAIIARRKRNFLVGREAGRIAPEPAIVGANGEALWDGRFAVTAPPHAQIFAGGLPEGDVPAFVREAFPKVLWRGETLDYSRWSLSFVMR